MSITRSDARRAVGRALERLDEARDPLALDASPAHGGEDPLERLIEAMLPVPPTTGSAIQATRNATARARFIAEFPTLSSTEVARAAGSGARNAAALANRWRKEGRVIGVPWANSVRYPAFQFDDDGMPLPAVEAVVDVLEPEASPWQIGLWFASPSPYLPGNARPLDLLSDVEAVVAAARAERDLPEF
jgi:hypothetical protein